MYTDEFVKQKFNERELWIKDNLLYEVISGSQAYGCETAESDYDIVGITMDRHDVLYPQQYGFIRNFDTLPNFQGKECKGPQGRIILPNGKECEGEWKSLTNFFYLAGVKGAPSLIETLFVRKNLITFSTKIGYMIRDNRRLFLSMRTFHAFKGYAFQQISRMRRGVDRWKREQSCDNKKRLHYFEQYGYDVKMGYHPLRLIDLVHQMLTVGDLDLMRNKDECKAMRNGDWGTFEELEKYVLAKIKELETLSLNTPLASTTQNEPLHNLLRDCIEEFYGSVENATNQHKEYVSANSVMEKLIAIEKNLEELKGNI